MSRLSLPISFPSLSACPPPAPSPSVIINLLDNVQITRQIKQQKLNEQLFERELVVCQLNCLVSAVVVVTMSKRNVVAFLNKLKISENNLVSCYITHSVCIYVVGGSQHCTTTSRLNTQRNEHSTADQGYKTSRFTFNRKPQILVLPSPSV